jgi:Zn-dependent peptidase ImmA (M78 family)
MIRTPTIEEIIWAYKEGLDFKVSKKNTNIKGKYFPDYYLIEIYIKNINSEKDYLITIGHEFIHFIKPKYSEEKVEKIAVYITEKNPEILYFMKDIFQIPNYNLVFKSNKNSTVF